SSFITVGICRGKPRWRPSLAFRKTSMPWPLSGSTPPSRNAPGCMIPLIPSAATTPTIRSDSGAAALSTAARRFIAGISVAPDHPVTTIGPAGIAATCGWVAGRQRPPIFDSLHREDVGLPCHELSDLLLVGVDRGVSVNAR